MDKAIAQKIAKDYIIKQMLKEPLMTLHEGPHFPSGIWGSILMNTIYSPIVQSVLNQSGILDMLLFLKAPAR